MNSAQAKGVGKRVKTEQRMTAEKERLQEWLEKREEGVSKGGNKKNDEICSIEARTTKLT